MDGSVEFQKQYFLNSLTDFSVCQIIIVRALVSHAQSYIKAIRLTTLSGSQGQPTTGKQ